MVTFTLSQSKYEFAKSRAIRTMRASVVNVPMSQSAKRVCQLRIFYVPSCQ